MKTQHLFNEPDEAIRHALREYRTVIRAAWPVTGKHRKTLGRDVAALSAALTGERADALTPDYMARPENISAYLTYFLPWNLLRLATLLPGLSLALNDGDTVADMGAGPFTVAQALWISRPDLREKKLHFVCLDRAPKILKLGKQLYDALAPDAPWTFALANGPLESLRGSNFRLITAANVLNEPGRKSDERAHRVASLFNRALGPKGQLLLVEPGTRAGAAILRETRAELIDMGFSPLAPCPHEDDCPMHGQRWCHFSLPVMQAPAWLADLSGEAGLAKDRLALSFVHMGRSSNAAEACSEGTTRIISNSFALPSGARGQYGCRRAAEEAGHLALVESARGFVPGSLAITTQGETPRTDKKSGLHIVHPLPATEPTSRKN